MAHMSLKHRAHMSYKEGVCTLAPWRSDQLTCSVARSATVSGLQPLPAAPTCSLASDEDLQARRRRAPAGPPTTSTAASGPPLQPHPSPHLPPPQRRRAPVGPPTTSSCRPSPPAAPTLTSPDFNGDEDLQATWCSLAVQAMVELDRPDLLPHRPPAATTTTPTR